MKRFLYRELWCKTPLSRLVISLVRFLVSHRFSRALLNWVYLRLNERGFQILYILFAKIFRDSPSELSPGYWFIHFLGRKLKIPLTRENSWLDWDTALCTLGHDLDVKQTYRYFLQNCGSNPLVFFDVGANYGTHSLLLAGGGGARVIAFEPNPQCHDYIRRLAEINELENLIQVEPCALGQTVGQGTLSFNPRDTWQGQIDSCEGESKECSIVVPISTLDAFVEANNIIPTLIKIDAEGCDLKVVSGGKNLLQNHRPIVIFESFGSKDRLEMFRHFSELGYELFKLPRKSPQDRPFSTESDFEASRGMNFGAFPATGN